MENEVVWETRKTKEKVQGEYRWREMKQCSANGEGAKRMTDRHREWNGVRVGEGEFPRSDDRLISRRSQLLLVT